MGAVDGMLKLVELQDQSGRAPGACDTRLPLATAPLGDLGLAASMCLARAGPASTVADAILAAFYAAEAERREAALSPAAPKPPPEPPPQDSVTDIVLLGSGNGFRRRGHKTLTQAAPATPAPPAERDLIRHVGEPTRDNVQSPPEAIDEWEAVEGGGFVSERWDDLRRAAEAFVSVVGGSLARLPPLDAIAPLSPPTIPPQPRPPPSPPLPPASPPPPPAPPLQRGESVTGLRGAQCGRTPAIPLPTTPSRPLPLPPPAGSGLLEASPPPPPRGVTTPATSPRAPRRRPGLAEGTPPLPLDLSPPLPLLFDACPLPPAPPPELVSEDAMTRVVQISRQKPEEADTRQRSKEPRDRLKTQGA